MTTPPHSGPAWTRTTKQSRPPSSASPSPYSHSSSSSLSLQASTSTLSLDHSPQPHPPYLTHVHLHHGRPTLVAPDNLGTRRLAGTVDPPSARYDARGGTGVTGVNVQGRAAPAADSAPGTGTAKRKKVKKKVKDEQREREKREREMREAEVRDAVFNVGRGGGNPLPPTPEASEEPDPMGMRRIENAGSGGLQVPAVEGERRRRSRERRPRPDATRRSEGASQRKGLLSSSQSRRKLQLLLACETAASASTRPSRSPRPPIASPSPQLPPSTTSASRPSQPSSAQRPISAQPSRPTPSTSRRPPAPSPPLPQALSQSQSAPILPPLNFSPSLAADADQDETLDAHLSLGLLDPSMLLMSPPPAYVAPPPASRAGGGASGRGSASREASPPALSLGAAVTSLSTPAAAGGRQAGSLQGAQTGRSGTMSYIPLPSATNEGLPQTASTPPFPPPPSFPNVTSQHPDQPRAAGSSSTPLPATTASPLPTSSLPLDPSDSISDSSSSSSGDSSGEEGEEEFASPSDPLVLAWEADRSAGIWSLDQRIERDLARRRAAAATAVEGNSSAAKSQSVHPTATRSDDVRATSAARVEQDQGAAEAAADDEEDEDEDDPAGLEDLRQRILRAERSNNSRGVVRALSLHATKSISASARRRSTRVGSVLSPIPPLPPSSLAKAGGSTRTGTGMTSTAGVGDVREAARRARERALARLEGRRLLRVGSGPVLDVAQEEEGEGHGDAPIPMLPARSAIEARTPASTSTSTQAAGVGTTGVVPTAEEEEEEEDEDDSYAPARPARSVSLSGHRLLAEAAERRMLAARAARQRVEEASAVSVSTVVEEDDESQSDQQQQQEVDQPEVPKEELRSETYGRLFPTSSSTGLFGSRPSPSPLPAIASSSTPQPSSATSATKPRPPPPPPSRPSSAVLSARPSSPTPSSHRTSPLPSSSTSLARASSLRRAPPPPPANAAAILAARQTSLRSASTPAASTPPSSAPAPSASTPLSASSPPPIAGENSRRRPLPIPPSQPGQGRVDAFTALRAARALNPVTPTPLVSPSPSPASAAAPQTGQTAEMEQSQRVAHPGPPLTRRPLSMRRPPSAPQPQRHSATAYTPSVPGSVPPQQSGEAAAPTAVAEEEEPLTMYTELDLLLARLEAREEERDRERSRATVNTGAEGEGAQQEGAAGEEAGQGGGDYDDLLLLTSVLGSALPAGATPAELSELMVAPVECERRRVTKSGKVKSKLSVVGVRCVDCAICLARFKVSQQAVVLPECLHIFHDHCIRSWFRLSRACPVCRAEVFPPPSAPQEDLLQ
ncbi:hypothetical protein JCM11641_000726 [Rhodosporidiobolus odoratus]